MDECIHFYFNHRLKKRGYSFVCCEGDTNHTVVDTIVIQKGSSVLFLTNLRDNDISLSIA